MLENNNKKEIVERFFENGHLLTPKALEFLLKTKNWLKILESTKNIDKLILSEEDFLRFETREDKVKIVKCLTNKPKELTTESFIRFYLSKLDKMKNIITSRINKDFVSLDKIDQKQNITYIIGIVKEVITEDNKMILEIEDITGSKNVIFETKLVENIDIDDVITAGVIYQSEDTLIGKEILYPDIPLRQPTKGFGKIAIISDLHMNEAPLDNLLKFVKFFEESDINFLLVAGDIEDIEKFNNIFKIKKTIFLIPGEKDDNNYPSLPLDIKNDNIISLSNPSMIEINNLKILIIHKFDIEMLKKRYLGKSGIILDEDYLVLDHVPDIVVCGHTHNPEIINYKSVTIANPGSLLAEFRPIIIDLSTREYEQLKY